MLGSGAAAQSAADRCRRLVRLVDEVALVGPPPHWISTRCVVPLGHGLAGLSRTRHRADDHGLAQSGRDKQRAILSNLSKTYL